MTGEETRIDTKTLTFAEYNTLSAEEQDEYTRTPDGFTKQVETQTSLSLNYQGLFVLAIGAIIQELQARIVALESLKITPIYVAPGCPAGGPAPFAVFFGSFPKWGWQF